MMNLPDLFFTNFLALTGPQFWFCWLTATARGAAAARIDKTEGMMKG
jgi:hypothetical protein